MIEPYYRSLIVTLIDPFKGTLIVALIVHPYYAGGYDAHPHARELLEILLAAEDFPVWGLSVSACVF